MESLATSKNIPITGASFVFGADTDGKRRLFLMPSTHYEDLDYQESFTIENGQFLTLKHVASLKLQPSTKNDENLVLSPNGHVSF